MRQYPPPQGSINEYGYRRFRCKDRHQRFEHVLVWEKHNGPVPDGFEIHHKNKNKCDNRIENLKLVTRLERKRIHSGCIRFGDTWLKRCRRCRWFREINSEFYIYPGSNGVMGVCKRCASELAVVAKKRRRQKQQAAALSAQDAKFMGRKAERLSTAAKGVAPHV